MPQVKVSTEVLQNLANNNPNFLTDLQQNPVQAIAQASTPLSTDAWIYRIVVLALGLTVLAVIIGGIVIAGQTIPGEGGQLTQKEFPAAIIAIGAAAGGALAGLLAPSPTGS